MLSIKAEGSAGADLRDVMMPEMLALARVTGCRVEVAANDTKFWVYPDDTLEDLRSAFDRLYPESSIVMSAMRLPAKRRLSTPPDAGRSSGGGE